MVFNVLGRTTFSNLQNENALFPMSVTPSGMVSSLISREDIESAPILFKEAGRTISVRFLQLESDKYSSSVRLSGSTICFSWFWKKQYFPSFFTVLGSVTVPLYPGVPNKAVSPLMITPSTERYTLLAGSSSIHSMLSQPEKGAVPISVTDAGR